MSCIDVSLNQERSLGKEADEFATQNESSFPHLPPGPCLTMDGRLGSGVWCAVHGGDLFGGMVQHNGLHKVGE